VELTLVSYNIHSCIGLDGRADLRRTAEVLREIDADVIALQEVGDFLGRQTPLDAPERLAEELGLFLAFEPNVVRGERRYGNAILSRLPILASHRYDLSVKDREPRGALRCDLDLGSGAPLHVFCVHLGLKANERRTQESLLLSADILQDAARVDPVIVCGDFNYFFSRPIPRVFRKAVRDVGHVLGARGRTYPSRLPLLRLDRVYVDHGVKPHALFPHRSPLARMASDHLPLVMRFSAPAALERRRVSGEFLVRRLVGE
jgi:endonuclease/exonuclease/phosphatase family metal-dependent hydrolase